LLLSDVQKQLDAGQVLWVKFTQLFPEAVSYSPDTLGSGDLFDHWIQFKSAHYQAIIK
jgi:hypothetical protein